jgi:predicted dehydrogenase
LNPKIHQIAVIGAGVWGKKVSSVVQGNSKYRVKNISARDFLNETKIIDLDQVDLIWICTNGVYQQEVLSLISKTTFEKHLIVEKPFCNDFFELENLIRIKQRIPLLRISNPWTYSKIWQLARELLVDNFDQGKIGVIRSGPEQRTYLSPPRDWLFHDLMLINDLAKNLNSAITVQNRSGGQERLWKDITLTVKNLEANLSGGFAENRVANWKASNENAHLEIDFNRMRLLFEIPSVHTQEQEISISDNPLLNMLESFEKDFQSREEFELQMNLLMVL